MIEPRADRPRPITLGADKAYDAEDFVNELRSMNATPHVAQNTSGRSSAIDGRTTRHTGYAITGQHRCPLIMRVGNLTYLLRGRWEGRNIFLTAPVYRHHSSNLYRRLEPISDLLSVTECWRGSRNFNLKKPRLYAR